MSFLFPDPPTYAQEQLEASLGSLATLSVEAPPAAAQAEQAPPSPQLQAALGEFTSSKPPSIDRLQEILKDLAEGPTTKDVSALDRAAQTEILTRAVTLIWAHVMETFVDTALKIEDDRVWWNLALDSRLGTLVYLVQSLPIRVIRAATETLREGKATAASFHPKSLREAFGTLHWPSQSALFRSFHSTSITGQLAMLASPLLLTRREMQANRRALTLARDGAALRVGILATQAPQWSRPGKLSTATSEESLADEASRVYSVLCNVLDVEENGEDDAGVDLMNIADTSNLSAKPHLKKLNIESQQASAQDLLSVLDTYLPRAHSSLTTVLSEYGRPSPLVRLWFGFLFLPPAAYFAASAIVRNKEWMKEQVRNAQETVKGFFVQWVWEPVEEIVKTMRGGGDGLGVAPETVKADRESLERMVMALGRDYYHLSDSSLAALKHKIEEGDLSLVLKAYESEMQNPIRNALTGNLIRTLLIQVQKTKTDLSLALEQLDQLLKSQQLTFAFVGVAPSVLVLWGVWSWLSTAWRGENRGKGRRRRYFHGMRNVERILITAPEDDARLSNRDRGMIIVSVSGLRTWAVGIGSGRRQNVLDDLRMVENPGLSRVDKLRVVDRMWRCWGLDGRRVVV